MDGFLVGMVVVLGFGEEDSLRWFCVALVRYIRRQRRLWESYSVDLLTGSAFDKGFQAGKFPLSAFM